MANWLWDNREWLFSGLGVVAFTTFITLSWRITKRHHSARSRMRSVAPSVPTASGAAPVSPAILPSDTERISSLSFEEVMHDMADVPPLQIEAIGARFKGVVIRWDTCYRDGKINSDEAAITLSCGPGAGLVKCTVKLSHYKELYYMRRGEPITVVGTIERVEPGSVFLIAVQLTFARDKLS